MDNAIIGREAWTRALLALFDEGFRGSQGNGTWYIDGEPGSGFLGTLAGLDARAASRPLVPGDPLTAASHVDHVLFALSLANRASRGENPYPTADWTASWAVRAVTKEEWADLVTALESEIADLRRHIETGKPLEDEMFATGIFGLVAHTAWHLGALRQSLGLIRAPSRPASQATEH